MAFPAPYAPGKVTDMSGDNHLQKGGKAAEGRIVSCTGFKFAHGMPKGKEGFLLGVFTIRLSQAGSP